VTPSGETLHATHHAYFAEQSPQVDGHTADGN